ncbi:hypothetical protein [Pajaroellobacter abortibovis]|uniref:hypothetical protein n=1 Tax=Pajaroellobacter abortibovis TaxID=1882918 RepID=UPI0012EC3054|nr:hypothetical protein [Pajaroellobacter abortibovis]
MLASMGDYITTPFAKKIFQHGKASGKTQGKAEGVLYEGAQAIFLTVKREG